MRQHILATALAAAVTALAHGQNLNPTVEVTNAYEGGASSIVKPAQRMAVPDSVMKFTLDFDYSVFDKPYEGAEAAYLIIQDQFDRADFAGIQDKVYDFSAKAGGQNYWRAKAFIVLGDTFAENGNEAQAKATFDSIKSGYTPYGPEDEVLDQVELRLRKLNK